MTIRHLKVFLAVCDQGGVTAASRKLFISQPSISAAITDIETEYGVKLFDRISRKLYLTEAGTHLQEQARYLVSLFDSIESDLISSGTRGILRVGSSVTIGNRFLPSVVIRFREAHPQIEVKAAINSSEQLERRVLENELDLALIEGIAHHPKIVSSVFLQDELVVVCANDDPLAQSGAVTPGELAARDLILREKGSGTRELFDRTMALQQISVEPIWESISTQAIVRAVQAGLGLSVLPYWLVQEELSAGAVTMLRLSGVELKRNYTIVYHADKFLTEPMRDFIALCREIRAN
ncbi:MAG: LysR family transcriptional regulator [Clostridiales bacterium]|nr:LysR family transcriptional regulator [Clostridiales bacterium]